MKTLITFLFSCCFCFLYTQNVSGKILLKGRESVYISPIFITNLTTQKTTLATINGSFTISAKKGDKLRFTSKRTERKDLLINSQTVGKKSIFVLLTLKARRIKGIVITRFRPSGNIKKDAKKLSRKNKNEAIKKAIGLPEPKVSSSEYSPASLSNGGFSLDVQSIYDMLSGELKKKKRRKRYENMQHRIQIVLNTIGYHYFTELKIPEHLIPNFLEFIYTSENKNLTPENAKILSEKYLPIYLERLENSNLID